MAPLSLGGFFGGECAFPGTQIPQSAREAPKVAPTFGEGIFGGNTARHFEGYFLLARQDPAKSMVETILSRKRFGKNLDSSKMWDPAIWQSAREGQKQRPLATAPTPGHSFLKAF